MQVINSNIMSLNAQRTMVRVQGLSLFDAL